MQRKGSKKRRELIRRRTIPVVAMRVMRLTIVWYTAGENGFVSSSGEFVDKFADSILIEC